MSANSVEFGIFCALAIFSSACGTEGPQGPPGPAGPEGAVGPAGSGGGGSVTFPSMIAAEQQRYVMLGQSWTFDFPEPPPTATALYLEVVACLSSGNSAGSIVQFKTPSAAFYVSIAPTTACGSDRVRAIDAKQIWMPTVAPHQLVADVPTQFGSVGNPTTRVRVLGWYEP